MAIPIADVNRAEKSWTLEQREPGTEINLLFRFLCVGDLEGYKNRRQKAKFMADQIGISVCGRCEK
jgi:hypothetical protein